MAPGSAWPEAEWRRQEMPARQAEPPAGSKAFDKGWLQGIVDAVRGTNQPGALLAVADIYADVADYARKAHGEAMTDTTQLTAEGAARRGGEGAPQAGKGNGR